MAQRSKGPPKHRGFESGLLLRKDDFDGAQALIDKMPEGRERSSFMRLLGQLLWNASVLARDADEEKSKDVGQPGDHEPATGTQ